MLRKLIGVAAVASMLAIGSPSQAAAPRFACEIPAMCTVLGKLCPHCTIEPATPAR
jgi:hypothetical protein